MQFCTGTCILGENPLLTFCLRQSRHYMLLCKTRHSSRTDFVPFPHRHTSLSHFDINPYTANWKQAGKSFNSEVLSSSLYELKPPAVGFSYSLSSANPCEVLIIPYVLLSVCSYFYIKHGKYLLAVHTNLWRTACLEVQNKAAECNCGTVIRFVCFMFDPNKCVSKAQAIQGVGKLSEP